MTCIILFPLLVCEVKKNNPLTSLAFVLTATRFFVFFVFLQSYDRSTARSVFSHNIGLTHLFHPPRSLSIPYTKVHDIVMATSLFEVATHIFQVILRHECIVDKYLPLFSLYEDMSFLLHDPYSLYKYTRKAMIF